MNSPVRYTDDIWSEGLSWMIEVAGCIIPPSSNSPNLVLNVLLLLTNEMTREQSRKLLEWPFAEDSLVNR